MKLRLVLFILAAAGAHSQDRGTIRGTVTDPTGAAVPGRTSRFAMLTPASRSPLSTGADGLYAFPICRSAITP